MKKLAILVLTVTMLSGCSWWNSLWGNGESATASSSPANAETAIKNAEAAVKKAASVDGLWRDTTNKFLKKAKASLAKGDNADALKLAKKAKDQADMGYQQAMDEKNAKPWLF